MSTMETMELICEIEEDSRFLLIGIDGALLTPLAVFLKRLDLPLRLVLLRHSDGAIPLSLFVV